MNPVARLTAVLIGVAAALLPAAAAAESLDLDGVERRYILEVPASARTPAPTVLLLHGGGGTPRQIQDHADFDALAGREGVVTVYPEGLEKQWNDGRENAGDVSISSADDVGFLRVLISRLIADGVADPDRIFMAGISNGGFMTLRIACEEPELIAGAAVVAANLPAPPICAPDRPTPIVFFHGTEDAWVPYAGGEVAPRARGYRGLAISAPATLDIWERINGCAGPRAPVALPDRAPRDDMHVTVTEYEACAAPLSHVVVEGGGHTWPGARTRRLMSRLVGPTTQDIDANEAMWRFWTTGSALQ